MGSLNTEDDNRKVMERRGRWREWGGPLLGFLLMAYQRPKLLHLRKWLILKTENWGSYRNEKSLFLSSR